MKRRARYFWLMALAALVAFLPTISRRDVVASHEARVVQTARQMVANGWPGNASPLEVAQVARTLTPLGMRMLPRTDGTTMQINPWIVPVMNGEIRVEKPPLPYWCAAIMFRIFGVGAGTARFIPALLGAISALLIWDLGCFLLGGVGGWFAILIWLSSYFVVDEFRKAMADPYLAAFTLGAIWCWTRGAKNDRPILFTLLFYACIALAMLSKGPIVFLILIPTLIALYFGFAIRLRVRLIAHAIGVVICLAIALPWYFLLWRTIPNVLDFWRYQSIGGLSDNVEKARVWYFYLPNLLQIILPWTPLWLVGIVLPIVYRRRTRAAIPIALAIIVFVFSLSHVKKNAYLLPAMPLAVLMSAAVLKSIVAASKNRRLAIRRITVIAIALAIAGQIFLDVVLVRADNARSPRQACDFALQWIQAAPDRSILVSRLSEEATVYLPLGLRDSVGSSEVLAIVDDRDGRADAIAHAIDYTAAGRVAQVESVAFDGDGKSRWKLFKLTMSKFASGKLPIERAAPSGS